MTPSPQTWARSQGVPGSRHSYPGSITRQLPEQPSRLSLFPSSQTSPSFRSKSPHSGAGGSSYRSWSVGVSPVGGSSLPPPEPPMPSSSSSSSTTETISPTFEPGAHDGARAAARRRAETAVSSPRAGRIEERRKGCMALRQGAGSTTAEHRATVKHSLRCADFTEGKPTVQQYTEGTPGASAGGATPSRCSSLTPQPSCDPPWDPFGALPLRTALSAGKDA